MDKIRNHFSATKVIIFTWCAIVLFGAASPREKIILTFVALSIALVIRLSKRSTETS